MKLRELRKAKGWSMKRLGEELGCSESTISLYENGKREPGFETLLRIGEIFGVSVDYLLGGPGGPAEPSSAAPDILDELDVAFLGDYGELTEENKATLRDMARLMLKNQGGGKE